jgi:uncharacterized protein YdbL (DUF1318 family)
MLIKIITKLVLVGFMLFMTASIAFAALTVSAAKQDGLVGEQADGLLGIVAPNSSVELTALVDKTNEGRLALYKATAEKNGTTLEQAQAVAGQTLIKKAAPGEYIQNASGAWQKK